MALVEIIKPVGVCGIGRKPGEIVEVSDTDARTLKQIGKAIDAKPKESKPTPAAPETAPAEEGYQTRVVSKKGNK